MNMNKHTLATLAAASLLTLAACGGGGDGSNNGDTSSDGGSAPGASTSSAQGLYIGTASNGRDVTGLVLDDGTYYFLYSSEDTPNGIGGVIQGSATAAGNQLGSSNMRDFNIEGLTLASGSVTATFSSKSSISGSVVYDNGAPLSFNAAYDSDYDTAPQSATLAGSYRGTVAFSEGYEAASIRFVNDGSFSGAGDSGCQVSGKATPRAHGNVYDLRLAFGGAPCLFANQTFGGIVYYRAADHTLYAAAPNGNRTDGVLFVATR